MRTLQALLVHPEVPRIHREIEPVVPAQMTTMPPRFTIRLETGKVVSPGCSKTISTLLPLP